MSKEDFWNFKILYIRQLKSFDFFFFSRQTYIVKGVIGKHSSEFPINLKKKKVVFHISYEAHFFFS